MFQHDHVQSDIKFNKGYVLSKYIQIPLELADHIGNKMYVRTLTA